MISDLDIVTADVRTRDRDRYLSVLYAPADLRPALFALHGIDLEMASIVVGTTEAMIGEIRLAWWREALEGLDRGAVPAQPLLALAAAEVVPRGVSGADLAGIEDRWLGMIGSEHVPATHVTGGELVFGLAARLLETDPAVAERLGEAWVLGDRWSGRVPAVLRPLLGLVRLAARDAARARGGLPVEVRGSLGRQWQLLRAVAFG
ncbi:MAG: squalene/phytoene synthase family protein [Sandarakinorhabdus sp.]|nr:squalene/phytoene synthase family protein [Sandarakinorhabdus sp.]